LTLEAAGFLAAEALRATDFGAAFFVFAVALDFAAVFFAGRSFAPDRADDLAAAALVALGLEGDFAFTARFALFAAGLAFERDCDRLNPFVRLLLMGGFSKGCSPVGSSRKIGPQLTIDHASKSTQTSICGCFTDRKSAHSSDTCFNKEKSCWSLFAVLKCFSAYGRLNPPRLNAPTE
jgi:hypothetical protein